MTQPIQEDKPRSCRNYYENLFTISDSDSIHTIDTSTHSAASTPPDAPTSAVPTNSDMLIHYNAITTPNTWLTDEPVCIIIDHIRQNANKGIYIAGAFTSNIIRLDTNNTWRNLGRFFNNHEAKSKHDGIYIIPTFTGSNTAGHWLVNLIRLHHNTAQGYTLDSLNNSSCSENVNIQLRIQEFFQQETWLGWHSISCKPQTEVECGPRMLWVIHTISHGNTMDTTFSDLLQPASLLYQSSPENTALYIRRKVGTLLLSGSTSTTLTLSDNNTDNICTSPTHSNTLETSSSSDNSSNADSLLYESISPHSLAFDNPDMVDHTSISPITQSVHTPNPPMSPPDSIEIPHTYTDTSPTDVMEHPSVSQQHFHSGESSPSARKSRIKSPSRFPSILGENLKVSLQLANDSDTTDTSSNNIHDSDMSISSGSSVINRFFSDSLHRKMSQQWQPLPRCILYFLRHYSQNLLNSKYSTIL